MSFDSDGDDTGRLIWTLCRLDLTQQRAPVGQFGFHMVESEMQQAGLAFADDGTPPPQEFGPGRPDREQHLRQEQRCDTDADRSEGLHDDRQADDGSGDQGMADQENPQAASASARQKEQAQHKAQG